MKIKSIAYILLLFVAVVSGYAQQSPVIDSIDPTSGIPGIVVSIRGSGFAASGNIIHFQNMLTSMVYEARITASSSDGVTLVFAVPSYVNPGCYYETPQCASPALQVTTGPYMIFAEVNGIRSNVKEFTITESATPTPDPGSSPPPSAYYLNITASAVTSEVTVTVDGLTNKYPILYSYTNPTTVTITANNYTHPDGSINIFNQWQGDITGNTNPVTFLVDGQKHITAAYLHGDPTPPPTIAPGTPAPDPTPTPYCFGYIIGDANGSGSIDIVDALIVAQYYIGLPPIVSIPLCVGDVNRDGTINIVDALLIAQCYIGLRSCNF